MQEEKDLAIIRGGCDTAASLSRRKNAEKVGQIEERMARGQKIGEV